MPRPRATTKRAPVQPVTVKSPTDIDRQVGKRLRALREEAGMSQTALGERSGITFQQVQKYENGLNRVSVSRLIQFCEACHRSALRCLAKLYAATKARTWSLRLSRLS